MKNQAGLLAKITNIFADHDISINSMVHKEVQENNQNPDIFLITSKTKEADIDASSLVKLSFYLRILKRLLKLELKN